LNVSIRIRIQSYNQRRLGVEKARELTLRAAKLNRLVVSKGYKAIEVHQTPTRRALNRSLKHWRKIQTTLTGIGLRGDLRTRRLVSHEIDAVMTALTAYLSLRSQTESAGDEAEGYVVLPKKQYWRNLKV
jgi:predicted nuclease with RNAse H fold